MLFRKGNIVESGSLCCAEAVAVMIARHKSPLASSNGLVGFLCSNSSFYPPRFATGRRAGANLAAR